MICKMKNFHIILVFLFIAIILIIAVIIHFFLIKYHTKQAHLIPFHGGSNKEIDIKNIL